MKVCFNSVTNELLETSKHESTIIQNVAVSFPNVPYTIVDMTEEELQALILERNQLILPNPKTVLSQALEQAKTDTEKLNILIQDRLGN